MHAVRLEDDVQSPDEDGMWACSYRASRTPGKGWPALLWSRDLSCGRRRWIWDGMQGDKRTARRPASLAGRLTLAGASGMVNGTWYLP